MLCDQNAVMPRSVVIREKTALVQCEVEKVKRDTIPYKSNHHRHQPQLPIKSHSRCKFPKEFDNQNLHKKRGEYSKLFFS